MLDGYILIDRAIEWSVPDMDYLSDADQRHQKIFDLIPQASPKNLLVSIRACERLLLFTDDQSDLHARVLDLWRAYMKELEKRHSATAGIYYSDMESEIRKKHPAHNLAKECGVGYNRCRSYQELQSRTIFPPIQH